MTRRLAVCGSGIALAMAAVIAPAPAAAAPEPPPAAPAPATPTGTALAGKTIFLDPGHQGSSAGHDLRQQVTDGRGGRKDCQTSGATGVNGVKEHTVNWEISQLVKAGLESQGAKVVLSRADDRGWGGCVDERAAAASRSGAVVAVSLHADSTSAGADASKKGFHMIVPSLPIPDPTVDRVQSGEGRKASTIMRDAFVEAGFPSANYAGVRNGIQTRSDIAAVNLTKVPAVFIEMGNLANPDEAKTLADKQGQLKYAVAITEGILKYANGDAATGRPPAQTTPTGDADGLASVIPFIEELMATEDVDTLLNLLLTEGQDVSAQVLKAMLTVVYGLFDGKLPIG